MMLRSEGIVDVEGVARSAGRLQPDYEEERSSTSYDLGLMSRIEGIRLGKKEHQLRADLVEMKSNKIKYDELLFDGRSEKS